MKIRQAPVADLMKYVEELYEDRENNKHRHIIEVLEKYYCSISNFVEIMPIGKNFIYEWCGINTANTMENCPNVPGIIVYKNNPDGSKTYGLIYHSGYIIPRKYQTDYMGYFDVDKKGHITSHTYLASDWDGWGAPTRFFKFDEEDFIDGNTWVLGERKLSKGCFGYDVRSLQNLLLKIEPSTPQTGHFDEKTEEALLLSQTMYKLPKNKVLDCESINGEKLIDYLADKALY